MVTDVHYAMARSFRSSFSSRVVPVSDDSHGAMAGFGRQISGRVDFDSKKSIRLTPASLSQAPTVETIMAARVGMAHPADR